MYITKYVNRTRGFTLIELMVTLGIAAIVLGMAAPAMRDMMQNSRISSQVNDLITAINMARSEAIKRGIPVSICRSSNLTGCDGAGPGSWANGWIVFDDANGNGAVDGNDIVMRVRQPLKGNPTLTGPGPVVYQPSGLVNAAAVFTHSIPGCTGNRARTINLSATGRALVTRQTC